jgi:hypothetical protein
MTVTFVRGHRNVIATRGERQFWVAFLALTGLLNGSSHATTELEQACAFVRRSIQNNSVDSQISAELLYIILIVGLSRHRSNGGHK